MCCTTCAWRGGCDSAISPRDAACRSRSGRARGARGTIRRRITSPTSLRRSIARAWRTRCRWAIARSSSSRRESVRLRRERGHALATAARREGRAEGGPVATVAKLPLRAGRGEHAQHPLRRPRTGRARNRGGRRRGAAERGAAPATGEMSATEPASRASLSPLTEAGGSLAGCRHLAQYEPRPGGRSRV